MALKPELVRRKLLAVDQAIGRLRSWLPLTVDQLEQDTMLAWAVERGLQIAAEALFDAGNHILASELRETVDRYAEVPPKLAARGVITAETAARLKGLAGFRNILVHEYADVDLTKVYAVLDRLEDLEAFIADVEQWLSRTGR